MSLADPTLREPALDEPIRSRHLRAIERPSHRRRPRLAYAIVALAGAALIGGAQIALSIATTQDSFVVSQLNQQNKMLNWQAQAAAQELDGVSSPQALAAKASAMGLVVGGSTNYLRLSDGTVIGAAGPAAVASTVDPTKNGGVANALVHDTPPSPAPAKPGTGVQPKTGTSLVAPPTAEGLPTPTIR
ncbi:hypothetical protein [Microbacterium sp. 22242]|uniref:hypothetical protein n=1 Tax=Microbacterium sp. 22242 TaxID=3453896 RepID=UPI003F84C2D3